MSTKLLDRSAYTIGWICALSVESAAAQVFLTERHEVPTEISDSNSYVTGRIGRHNVVIVVMPQNEYGTTSAATTAKEMVRSFPQVRLGLMVGIGGGAPSQDHDVRLGDIVVSSRGKGTGGVIQVDYGKTIQNQDFKETGHLNQPPTSLMTAVAALDAHYDLEGPQLHHKVIKALQKQRSVFRRKYSRPSDDTDRLYRSELTHPGNLSGECDAVCGVRPEDLVHRPTRSDDDDNPSVHYGLIASSNQVMKDAVIRDRLGQRGVLCFEMEAAGLMNHFPCLVVRGICDYADTHKNSHWQPYAAMVAAAYAADLIERVNPSAVEAERKLSDLIISVLHLQKEQHRALNETKDAVVAVEAQVQIKRLRQRLKPVEPSDNANRARDLRYEETGGWFLSSDVFNDWLAGRFRHLALYGLGGCGKTVLSSTILDFLLEDRERVVLYFYFDFSDTGKRTLEGLARSLLVQLYSHQKYSAELRKFLDDDKRPVSTNGLLQRLRDTLETDSGSIYILMDALDECKEGLEMERLVKWITSLSSAPTLGHVKIITTARPEVTILKSLTPHQSNAAFIHLDEDSIKNDIHSYIQGCLRDRPGFHTHAPQHPIVKRIPEALAQKADGIFRYAACHMDDIVSCLGPEEIEDVLESLPNTIQETYKRSLGKIPPRYHDKAIRLLQFLVTSKRPLELQTAVDIVSVRSDFRPFDPTDRIYPEDIVRLCPNLLSIVEIQGDYDSQRAGLSQLHLAHMSVKEYLIQFECEKFTFVGPSVSVSIVRTCLSYILGVLLQVHDDDDDIDALLSSFWYTALLLWIEHAAVAEVSPEAVCEMAQYLEYSFDIQRPWTIIRHNIPLHSKDLKTSGLHFACYLDLRATAKALIMRGVDVNLRGDDEFSMNPLEIASYLDQVEIVQLLLEYGASPNTAGSKDHGSAMRISFERGNYRVARLLASKGANLYRVEGIPGHRKSLLDISIAKLDVELIQFLLDEGIDVNLACSDWGAVLQAASAREFDEIAALILRNGANANAKGGIFDHALQAAAEKGHSATLKLLLENGADVNAHVGSHGNALCAAVRGGHQDTIELLLERGADPNVHSGRYGSALGYTWMCRSPGMMKLVLAKGVDMASCLLHYKGFEYSFHICMRRFPDDGIITDGFGVHTSHRRLTFDEADTEIDSYLRPIHNALWFVLEFGLIYHRTHSILYNACTRDEDSKRKVDLLYFAALEEDFDLVDLLLSSGADQNRSLRKAVKQGESGAVRMLLSKGADPNIVYDASRSSVNHNLLMESLCDSSQRVAWQLLLFGADPNSKTSRHRPNQTALQLALEKDLEGIVQLLLENGADPNGLSDFPSFTPLQLSIKAGSIKYIRLLLEHGADIEALGGYSNNLTAFDVAEKIGNAKILQLVAQSKAERGLESPHRREARNESTERFEDCHPEWHEKDPSGLPGLDSS